MGLPLLGILAPIVSGVKGYFERKQKVQEAITENKCRLARDSMSNNHEWEMRQLSGAGIKDDILFYGFVAVFVWAGFDPDGAREFFVNLQTLPEWFIKTWFWLVASVIGVKKIGDYLPSAIRGIRDGIKSD